MRTLVRYILGSIVIVGLSSLAVWTFVNAVIAEPAIVGSIATASTGVLGILWQQRRSENARLREAHRERMTPTYEGLLDHLIHYRDSGAGKERTEDLATFMRDLKGKQLLLGAPKEMIRAFHTWQQVGQTAGSTGDTRSAVLALGDLLLAIRQDLGHDDSDLERAELLRIFVDDYDQAITSS